MPSEGLSDGIAPIRRQDFGATPCNAARRLVRENKSAILTGLNAPMMIKAVQYSPAAEDLAAFTECVREAAVKGIFAITSAPEDLVCRRNEEQDASI